MRDTRARRASHLSVTKNLASSPACTLPKSSNCGFGIAVACCRLRVTHLDPEYPRNLVPSRELFAKGINGLCLWYILEIRARTERYERLLACEAQVRVHRFRLEELRVSGGAARFLQALGYPMDPARIRMPAPQNVGRMMVRIDAAEETSIRQMIAAAGLDSIPMARRTWLSSTPC